MKTFIQRYGQCVLLLMCIGMTWLKCDVCTIEAVTASMQHLGSLESLRFAGLYSLAPTLHLRDAVPPMSSATLCGAVLSRGVILMSTTIGIMMVCLTVHYLGRRARIPDHKSPK